MQDFTEVEEIGNPPLKPRRFDLFYQAICLAHQQLLQNTDKLYSEQGGLLLKGDNYANDPTDILFIEHNNTLKPQTEAYSIEVEKYLEYVREKRILLYIHTHPRGSTPAPSQHDLVQSKYCDCDWTILSSDDNTAYYLEAMYVEDNVNYLDDNNNLPRVVTPPYPFSTALASNNS